MNDGSSCSHANRNQHLLDWLVLAVLVLPAFGERLVGDFGELGRDFAFVFLDGLHQQLHALQDGVILLWDRMQLGGTDHWSRSNSAPVYPPIMILSLLLGSLRGLNATLYLQVLWGAIGVYMLVRHLSGRRVAALFGGLFFAYAHYSRFLCSALPLEFVGLTWLPWTVYFLTRAVSDPRWVRFAILAGVCQSAIPWVGAYILFLPGFVLIGTFVVVAHSRPPWMRSISRATGILAVLLITFAAVSAARLLPVQHWAAVTNRAEGVTREFALDGSLTLAQMFDWTDPECWSRKDGFLPWILLAIGLLIRVRRLFDWILPFGAAVVLLVLMSNAAFYGLLFDYVPGFNHVREPRRSWLLMPIALPIAAALAIARLQDWAPRRVAARIACVAALAGVFALDQFYYAGFDPPERYSLSAAAENNAIHQDLARRTQTESRFRVIDYAKARTRPKATADVMRSYFDVESLEGLLGNIEIAAWGDEYLQWSRDDRAKVWGLMNCRYVISSKAIAGPGLLPIATFPRDPNRISEGIDGPHLYRNELELPRAFLIDRAILAVGGNRDMRRWLFLFPRWDPRRTVVLSVDLATYAAMDAPSLRRFNAVVFLDPVEPALRSRLDGVCPSAVFLPQDDTEVRSVLTAAFTEPPQSLRPIADPVAGWNDARIAVPPDAAGRWLVLAETYSLYPGWSARVDGTGVPLFKANSVATAIHVPSGAREATFSYVPAGFVPGVAISSVTVLALAAFFLVPVIRRRRAARPAVL